jgi:hypothetical protein
MASKLREEAAANEVRREKECLEDGKRQRESRREREERQEKREEARRHAEQSDVMRDIIASNIILLSFTALSRIRH